MNTKGKYEMLCWIWYHLYNLRNVKNTHSGVLFIVKLQADTCNFTKSNTPPQAFFRFLKLLISKWVYNWKMLFNSDPSKPAQEVLFSKKKENSNSSNHKFQQYSVERTSHHKHLVVLLDEKLNFKQYIDITILKINKGIPVIKKLRHSLPRKSLMTIYKTF